MREVHGAARLAVLAVVAALAAPAGAGAEPGLETIVQDDAQLIFRSAEEVDASMRRLVALGVDRVRLTAIWSALTREADSEVRPEGFAARNPAAYEQPRWRALDQAVGLARARGLRVLLDIGFWAPHWAADDPPGTRARTNIDPRAFADFTVAVVRRYSGRFTPPDDFGPAPAPSADATLLEQLLGGGDAEPVAPPPAGRPLARVGQFAIGNEPNHPGQLLPQWDGGRAASPAQYRRLLRAAYWPAKRVRPDATFLIGNTSSMGSEGAGAVPPLRFVRELACVGRDLRPRAGRGCRRFTTIPGDGWAHHPYALNRRPDQVLRGSHGDNVTTGNLGDLTGLLRRLAADGRVMPGVARVHITEFGYETEPIGDRPPLGLRTQARWLTWAERLATRTPGVVSFAQFLLRDQPPGPVRVSDSEARAFGQFYTGLQFADGRDKPAARSFVAGLLARRRADGRVSVRGRLRLGAGLHEVVMEQRLPGGRWGKRLALRAGGRGWFVRTLSVPPGTRLRLRWTEGARTVAGVPVRVGR